jgi:hypothetical protein
MCRPLFLRGSKIMSKRTPIISIPRAESIRRRLYDTLLEADRLKLLLTVATELERIPERSHAEIERDFASEIASAQRVQCDSMTVFVVLTSYEFSFPVFRKRFESLPRIPVRGEGIRLLGVLFDVSEIEFNLTTNEVWVHCDYCSTHSNPPIPTVESIIKSGWVEVHAADET